MWLARHAFCVLSNYANSGPRGAKKITPLLNFHARRTLKNNYIFGISHNKNVQSERDTKNVEEVPIDALNTLTNSLRDSLVEHR